MTPQCRTRKESQGKTARHATLNAASVVSARSAVNAASARNAAAVVSVAGAQSAVANAITVMPMPMSRATAAPMHRRRMRAVRVARHLAERGEAKIEGKAALRVAVRVALKVVGRAATSAGQTAARVSMTQCKRVLLPTR